jgi:exosortase K
VKTRLCVLLVAALVAWGMKRHYADTGADDLWWILRPTAGLVETVTGVAFVKVPAEGYVSHERLFVIEKVCAGINFMIAAFGMLVLARLHRVRSGMSGAVLVSASLVVSYAAAIGVNAARIAIALRLAGRPPVSSVSAAQIHRVEGVVVYFVALWLLYDLTQRFDRRRVRIGRSSC